MSWFAPAASLFKYAKHCLDPDVSSYDPQYAEQAAALEKKYLAAAKPRHHHAIKLALLDYFGRRKEALISLPGPLERLVKWFVLILRRFATAAGVVFGYFEAHSLC